MSTKEKNPFDILELAPSFDLPDLEAQFLALQKIEHPDLFVGNPEKQRAAEERFSQIVWAYEELKDPLKRAQWLFKEQGLWPLPQDLDTLEELLEIEEKLSAGQLLPGQRDAWVQDAFADLSRTLKARLWEEAAKQYFRLGAFTRLQKRDRTC